MYFLIMSDLFKYPRFLLLLLCGQILTRFFYLWVNKRLKLLKVSNNLISDLSGYDIALLL